MNKDDIMSMTMVIPRVLIDKYRFDDEMMLRDWRRQLNTEAMLGKQVFYLTLSQVVTIPHNNLVKRLRDMHRDDSDVMIRRMDGVTVWADKYALWPLSEDQMIWAAAWRRDGGSIKKTEARDR